MPKPVTEPNCNMEAPPDSQNEGEALASVTQRCRLLVEELQQFQSYLKQQKREHTVEMRPFKIAVSSEMKLLDKLASADPQSPKTAHALRSSNYYFFDIVWSTAKRCTGVIALRKRFYWLPGQRLPYTNGKVSTDGTRHRNHSAVVDIVAQDGLEWIKVSSATEKRIIWDMAKAGWVGSSSDESDDASDAPTDDEYEPQGLVKQIEALVKASQATRVRYRHPKIRLVLPRINRNCLKEVAEVLEQIRKLGVIVQTAEDVPKHSPQISMVLQHLAADRFESFSEVLNIDCTVLLAFASDLSHGRVEPEDWHNKAISRQIEMESEDQLLPSSLLPACGSREMVCTREAAIRMLEIVETIGTETEKKRTALLLDIGRGGSSASDQCLEQFQKLSFDLDECTMSKDQRLEEFQKLSDYRIPPVWNLPIKVVDVNLSAIKSELPSSAEEVSKKLTIINQSVFLYGWKTGRTTISSNRAVSKDIESTIEGNRTDEDERGPDIWLCPTSRSLVGKEKQRRGANDPVS